MTQVVEDFLEHYGVKGMKWGVRNDKGHEGERVKTSKLAKLDKKWEKENTGTAAYMRAYNAAAEKMNNGGIDAINNKPEYSKAADDGTLMDMNHPTTKKYFEEHEAAFQDAMVDYWGSVGSNPSGTKKFEIREVDTVDGNGEKYRDVFLVDVKRDVKHAEEDEVAFRLDRSPNGLVEEYVLVQGELKHYGVKGMKWGVRKRDTSPQDVTVSQPKPGGRVKASGGKNQPASEDARLAAATRQKARKSTTDSLSNAELQALVNRMNLEQQYARLAAPKKTAGQKFAEAFLGDLAKRKVSANLDQMAEEDPKVQQVAEAFKKTAGLGKDKKKN